MKQAPAPIPDRELRLAIDADTRPPPVEATSELRAALSAAEQRAAQSEADLARLQQALKRQRQDLAEAHTLTETTQIQRNRLAYFLLNTGYSARRGALGRIARFLERAPLAKQYRLIRRSGLFDRSWYKRTYPDVVASKLDPLVHYLLFGGYDGRRPNRVFDSAYYIASNPDVRASGDNPLVHYVREGESQGRLPSPDFDPVAYIQRTPGAEGPKGAALAHFLRKGRLNERVTKAYRPPAPAWSLFEDAARAKAAAPQAPIRVDVVVPVYRGRDETLAALASVLGAPTRTPYELVVVDDCSPEPALSEDLRRLAELGLITLLRNDANLGFVGAVNRAMRLHPDRDVVLLNSDTLVFNDWLDRLLAHAGEDVATITPFSNNATICSYPVFCENNPSELELPFGALDLLAAEVNRGRSVDVPTGVGFCMYMRRAAIEAVGLFDEATFGRGYGEENDFCVRAEAAGWRNTHALDVFVFHSGEMSFSADAAAMKQRNYQRLIALHPTYEASVHAYIGRDPPSAARAALDLARLIGRKPQRPVLIFTHSRGGGVERHVVDCIEKLRAEGRDAIVATPARDGTHARLSVHGRACDLHNLSALDFSVLDELIPLIGVERAEIHSLVGWSATAPQRIPRMLADRNVTYTYTLHDYAPICPQINFIGPGGLYCGELGPAQCDACLRAFPAFPYEVHPDLPRAAPPAIDAWRAAHAVALQGASKLIAPSGDTAQRFKSYFPDLDIHVAPHAEDVAHVPFIARPWAPGQPVRVVIIGAIGPHKGSQVLLACARDARARGLPLQFTIVGTADIISALKTEGVEFLGPYLEHEVGDFLTLAEPHLAFLPSVWPETYSYTLSIARKAGLPTVVFDLGAPAERLGEDPNALRLALDLARQPERINDALLHFAQAQARPAEPDPSQPAAPMA